VRVATPACGALRRQQPCGTGGQMNRIARGPAAGSKTAATADRALECQRA